MHSIILQSTDGNAYPMLNKGFEEASNGIKYKFFCFVPTLVSGPMRTFNCSMPFTNGRRIALKVTYLGFDSLSKTLRL